jgi:TetR/AcrR family transcriptional regulator of autoinduction and epiphytic fitness
MAMAEKPPSTMASMADATAPIHDPSTEASTDGRRLRAERNRDAVVDAILDLLREGNRHPQAAEIAERAGVSLRSVFRHFDDLQTLDAVAVQRHSDLIAPLFVLTPPEPPKGKAVAPIAARLDAIIAQRSRLYEEMAPVRAVAERRRDRSEAIQKGLERSRRILKRQLTDLFDPELTQVPVADRRELVDALEAACSYKAWSQLREDQKLSVPRSEAAMRRSLAALLS